MTKGELVRHFEAAAEGLVLAETSDLQALAAVHTLLEEVVAGVEKTRLAKEIKRAIVSAAEAAVERMSEIILGDATDIDAAIQAVGEAIGAMVSIVRDGRPVDELILAPDLLCEASPSAGPSVRILPVAVDQEVFDEFLSRQKGVLDDVEHLIIEVEKTDSASEACAALRRLVHTLKGEASLLDLQEVVRLSHAMEDYLSGEDDAVVADPLLSARDWLSASFDILAQGRGDIPPVEPVLQALSGEEADGFIVTAPEPIPLATKADEHIPLLNPEDTDHSLLAEFSAEAAEHLEQADGHLLTLGGDAENEESLNAIFRDFHTIKGVAGFLGLQEIHALAHEVENLLDKTRKGLLSFGAESLDILFASVDILKEMLLGLRAFLTEGTIQKGQPNLGELLVRIVAATQGMPAPKRRAAPKTGTMPSFAQPEADAEPDESEQEVRRSTTVMRAGAAKLKETVRVDADRLDRLVDTIGELVIAESMVSQSVHNTAGISGKLAGQLGHLDKIARTLQEIGAGLRMTPVRSTFQKMARLVRDLSTKSGKDVELVITGEDTELDKSVVDRIGDPLVHLVRNAVDHGLESSAEERKRAGKDERGRVELHAYHRGGAINIDVCDDGRGLNREAILAKGVERGLITEDEELTEREVWDLIFQPGFSTAKTVSDVSGRGVGMDVVRRNVEALRGVVEVETTPGAGSVFRLRLPLTLAIIDGMVVRVAGERYIIPTLNIMRTLRPLPQDVFTVTGRGEVLQEHDHLLPLARLHQVFNLSGHETPPTEGLVVVVEEDNQSVGLVLDELLGKQQIVIKTLGDGMPPVPGIAGGAIMPDGQVGLILDIVGLIKLARERGKTTTEADEEAAAAGGVPEVSPDASDESEA